MNKKPNIEILKEPKGFIKGIELVSLMCSRVFVACNLIAFAQIAVNMLFIALQAAIGAANYNFRKSFKDHSCFKVVLCFSA